MVNMKKKMLIICLLFLILIGCSKDNDEYIDNSNTKVVLSDNLSFEYASKVRLYDIVNIVDGKITSDNIVMNENSKSITIFLSRPIKEVQLLEEETSFGEVKKGIFVFGDIVHTPEEYENIKHNIKCQALTKMMDMDEQAEKAASNSIKKIIITVTKNNYDIKIVFIK